MTAATIAIVTAAVLATDPRILIAPGVEMPYVFFGGIPSSPSNYTDVLASGGRGLDTALTYGKATQLEVAAAVKAAVAQGIPRLDIFVTTKIPCCPTEISFGKGGCSEAPGSAADNIAADIEQLGGPVDLILMHWPCSTHEQTAAVYTALEDALAAGKTRAIGVSNFNASELEALVQRTNVKPAVNQCNHAIGAHKDSYRPTVGADDATVRWCQSNNVSYSAWSPLGGIAKSGVNIFKDPTVLGIAKAHGVGAAQVALRWLVQQNITVVTAATEHEYIVEDLDVFSFTLTPTEMAALAAL